MKALTEQQAADLELFIFRRIYTLSETAKRHPDASIGHVREVCAARSLEAQTILAELRRIAGDKARPEVKS